MSRPPKYASELLLAVGKLSADMEHAKKQNDEIKAKLDIMDARLRKVEPLIQTVDDMEKDVSRHNKWEQRGLGVWLVVTLFGSVFGGVLLRKIGIEVG
jgi:hypothetical protein